MTMRTRRWAIVSLLMVVALTVPLATAMPVLAAAPSVSSFDWMAFSTPATSHDVPMPASVDEDDLLIVLFAHSGTGSVSVTPSTGWTQLASDSQTGGPGGDITLSVYYKEAVGNEDGGTVDFTTGSDAKAIAQVYRIDKDTWDVGTPPEISVAATATTNQPDPPALDPSGWDVEDTLWIAVCAYSSYLNTSGPDDYYSPHRTSMAGSQPWMGLSSNSRENPVASEDPSYYDIETDDSYGSVAYTIGVRPAGASPAPAPAPKAVGGEAYAVSKVGVAAPFVALAMAIAAGGFYVLRRRAHAVK